MAHQKKQRGKQTDAELNAAAIRVRAIVDTITAVLDVMGTPELETDDDNLRHMAEQLGVPFLAVRLAADNWMTCEHMADLDDILEGLQWLDAHGVPSALLRRTAPRGEEWRASLKNKKLEQAPAGKES